MKLYLSVFWLLLFAPILHGQGLSHEPTFIHNDMIWNPGSTAEKDFIELGMFYRNQWAGFEGAPTTMMLHYEYPFKYKNISLGGYVYSENSGLINNIKAAFSYAYKFKLGINRHDKISLGMSFNASKISLDVGQLNATHLEDSNLYKFDNIGLRPDFDFGFLYLSNSKTSSRFRKHSYYLVGFSINSIINGLQLFRNNNNSLGANGGMHYNFMLGLSKEFPFGKLTSKSWLSYTNIKAYRVGFSSDLYFANSFSVGVIGATDGSAGIKIGTELKNSLLSDGFLKIGISANNNLFATTLQTNPTIELYIAYTFKNNWDSY